MEAIVERAAGLDVHQSRIVACILIGRPGRRPTQQTRSFGTMTADLEELRAWLEENAVTHVGLESTGVYWCFLHEVLDGPFTVLVGNPNHIRNLPGRKTDVRDAEWIADLVRHGLLKPSFVPPPAIRELRALVRFRRVLAGQLSTERNRVLKLLEGANVKLASVVTDVFGVSGRTMLAALAEGRSTPAEMADLAKRRLRRKLEPLTRALDGRLTATDRHLLGLHLRRLEEIDRDIAEIEARIEQATAPYRAERDLLVQIPGVDVLGAAAIIAETGPDMPQFGSARRLAAWAGVCPANHESAGRQKRHGTRKGNVHLKTTLMTAAVAATNTKGSFWRDKYYRLKARLGAKRAAMAIAHKILVAVFAILSRKQPFKELGPVVLEGPARVNAAKRLVRRLAALGYDVLLRNRPDPEAAATAHPQGSVPTG